MGKSLQKECQRSQKGFWKRVTKNESRELGAMCDENGVVIADEQRVPKRWKEYFEGLLDVDA